MPKATIPATGLADTWGRRNRKLADRSCQHCGAVFRPARESSRYCSKRCRWANNGGHNRKPQTWWLNSRGYIEGKIWLDEHTQIRVKKHRWIMEHKLGRKLGPDEDVHHIDGNKLNNAPENLRVMTHGDHTKATNSSRDYRKGYKMDLSTKQRRARALRAKAQGLAAQGRAAIAEAKRLSVRKVSDA